MRLCVCVCVCSFICIYLYVCVCVCVWCSRRKVKQEGSFRLCLSNRHIFNQSRLVWSNWCYCCDHHLFCCLRSNANPQSNCQSNSEWDRSSLLRNNPQDWDWLFLSFLLRSFPPPPPPPPPPPSWLTLNVAGLSRPIQRSGSIRLDGWKPSTRLNEMKWNQTDWLNHWIFCLNLRLKHNARREEMTKGSARRRDCSAESKGADANGIERPLSTVPYCLVVRMYPIPPSWFPLELDEIESIIPIQSV